MIKKITKITSVILLSSTLITGSVIAKDNKNVNPHKDLNLPKNAYVVDYKEADVTGDSVKDKIYLVGTKENKEDIYASNLNIIIKNGKTKKLAKTESKDFGGYEGHLFIGDFTGDKVNDILATADTGGSGGIIENRIYTLDNDKINTIFNEKDNEGVDFKGKFVDGYKAELKSEKINKEITLDISGNKKDYIEGKIYDEKGKLLSQVEPYTHSYGALEPVQYENGTYYLQGQQRIVGFANPDTLSNVRSVWKYENSKWVPVEVEYGTFLNLNK